MKRFRLINRHTIVLAASFLLFLFQMKATDRDIIYISSTELHKVAENSGIKYVYLGKELSDLYEVISQIGKLDNNRDSVISKLQEHVENGFDIGLYDSVVEVLNYAAEVLEENSIKISTEEFQNIYRSLEEVVAQVADEALTINTNAINDLSELYTSFDRLNNDTRCIGRSSCRPSDRVIKVRSKLNFLDKVGLRRNVQIDGKLKADGKAVFKNDVKFEKDVCFEDHVYFNHDVTFRDKIKFKEDVTFEENVNIEGSLSVTDLVVRNCMNTLCVDNLSVVNESISGTLSVNNEFANNITVNTLTVNDFIITGFSVVGCFANLCVNNLSVANEIVSGALTVNNEIATNITVDSLSANNAIINTLSVVDCINNLCILNLSVVDEEVSGTLSVNNEFANNITVTNLSVTNGAIIGLSVINCLASLCVNDLSVVNETASGTLSVNNEIVSNITATSLSVVDAIITNETVTNLSATNAVITNLSVTNCMASLCVNNLSVVNESASGTLSATDIVVGTFDIVCDITVGCNISLNDSTSPAVGNIIKNNIPFMNNFGTDNTFIGDDSGNFTMTGIENVGVGLNALASNVDGFDNVAVGAFALPSNTGGASNVAVGTFSLANNTIGSTNSAFGGSTLVSNTVGVGNTAVGIDAGFSLTSGDNNIFMGNRSALSTTTGSTNIMIGYNAGLSLLVGDDNVYIANPGNVTEDGTIRIGTPAIHKNTLIQGIFGVTIDMSEVSVDASGQLGTTVSSRRFKHDIESMDDESADLYGLRPVSFVYNSDETNSVQYGLIAEEVDQVFSGLVVYDEEGKPYTVRYNLLPKLLLNEVQKLHDIVQDRVVAIEALKSNNKKIDEAIQVVNAKITALCNE